MGISDIAQFVMNKLQQSNDYYTNGRGQQDGAYFSAIKNGNDPQRAILEAAQTQALDVQTQEAQRQAEAAKMLPQVLQNLQGRDPREILSILSQFLPPEQALQYAKQEAERQRYEQENKLSQDTLDVRRQELEAKVKGENAGSWEVTKDQMGNPIRVNKLTGEVSAIATPGGGESDFDSEVTGDEYLATIDPRFANTVKAIAEGRVQPPNGRSEKAMQILNMVTQYDPTFDAANAPARFKAVKDFTSGTQGNTVRSLNVAVSHLNTLDQLGKALENGNVQVINKLKNSFATQAGRAAPPNFEAAKGIVADEIIKAVVGNGSGALADRQEVKKDVMAASSAEQLSGVIKTYKELMAGQLHGLKQQYEDGTGRKDFDKKLSKETMLELNGVQQNASDSADLQSLSTEELMQLEQQLGGGQ